MLNIYLARHGQDEDNSQGILNGRRNKPLTKIGLSQAREVAEKIKGAGLIFNKIYSSPLERAYRTAVVIAETLETKKPVKLQNLIERDFGIMTGRHHGQIRKICSPNILETEKVTYFLKPEGAETFPQLVKRGKKVLKEIKKYTMTGTFYW